MNPYVAVPPVFVANGLFNFFLNRHWSFPRSGLGLRTELTRFCVVALGSLAVNYTSLYLLHDVAGLRRCPRRRWRSSSPRRLGSSATSSGPSMRS